MATPSGTQSPDLSGSPLQRVLQDDPCSFDFFQAVMLLHRLFTARQSVGRFCNPQEEVVHFRANNQLAFPASQIQGVEIAVDDPAQMAVNFMGLTGPMGVLPICYTELVIDRTRSKDHALRSFLDIFNHRMISFFYRAWEKHRFPVTYQLHEDDLFTHHLLDLIGMGTPGLQNRQPVPDEALLHFTGLLGKQSRSAAALEAILAGYFEVPVEVEQFTGAWYRLDPGAQCCMDDDDCESQQLGQGAVIGDEIWNQQSRIRVKLGPLSLDRYRDFLPEGNSFEPLRSMTKFFCNDEFDFEVQLILKRDDVPRCDIGSENAGAPQLGWITWLKSVPLGRDPEETILSL